MKHLTPDILFSYVMNNFHLDAVDIFQLAIILIFVLQIFLEILNMNFVPVGSNIVEFCAFIFNIIGNAALWISTIICVISGVIYIWDNKKFISEK